jgi:hypothetical protein
MTTRLFEVGVYTLPLRVLIYECINIGVARLIENYYHLHISNTQCLGERTWKLKIGRIVIYNFRHFCQSSAVLYADTL